MNSPKFIMPEEIDLVGDAKMIFIRRNVPGTCIIGYDFGVGSELENDKENGISHFLEHNMFKGTEKRDKNEISFTMEKNAANMNAYTSKNNTYYYADVPVEGIEECTEVLFDMVFNSIFPDDEVKTEREVVAEEYKMAQEKSTTIMHYNMDEAIYGKDTPYGRTILGKLDNISSFTRDDLIDYYRRWYKTGNLTVYLVGDESLNKEKIVEKINNLLSSVKDEQKGKVEKPSIPYELHKTLIHQPKKFEHNDILITFPYKDTTKDFDMNEALRFNFFSNILSLGFSMPFFRIVRDEHGLVYSCSTFFSDEKPCNNFNIYGSTSKDKLPKFLELTHDIVLHPEKYVTKKEFEIVKNFSRAAFYRMLENKGSFLRHIMKEYRYGRDYKYFLENYFEILENVKFEEVMEFSNVIEKLNPCISITGKLDERKNEVFDLCKNLYGDMETIEK